MLNKTDLFIDDCQNHEHLHFMRLVFGVRPTPAVLGAVIDHHLAKYEEKFPDLVHKIESFLYVDLVAGADTLIDPSVS